MALRSMLLAGLCALALPGCVLAVEETTRFAPTPPLAHGPIHNDAPHGMFRRASQCSTPRWSAMSRRANSPARW